MPIAVAVERRGKTVDKVSCPSCEHPISAVVNSRGPHRVRVCGGCGASYLTQEAAVRLLPRGYRHISARRNI